MYCDTHNIANVVEASNLDPVEIRHYAEIDQVFHGNHRGGGVRGGGMGVVLLGIWYSWFYLHGEKYCRTTFWGNHNYLRNFSQTPAHSRQNLHCGV